MHATATEPVMMVLHDLPNGATRHLDRVLVTWQDQGVASLPTAPDACVPMRAGRPGPDFSDFVSPDPTP